VISCAKTAIIASLDRSPLKNTVPKTIVSGSLDRQTALSRRSISALITLIDRTLSMIHFELSGSSLLFAATLLKAYGMSLLAIGNIAWARFFPSIARESVIDKGVCAAIASIGIVP
jgi:hypothetical protein